jgi:Domain of unknown function (DUF4249)
MSKYLFLLATTFVFFLFSCEEELQDIRITNEANAVIVSGEISNLTGPYIIRLNKPTSYSPYDVREFTGIPITKAKVEVVDNRGEVYPFTEISSGVYQSSLTSFRGVVGNSYVLQIKTNDGKIIVSRSSKILSPPQLSHYDYVFNNAEKVEDITFKVTSKIRDEIKQDNYYLIKKQEYIQFLTTCPPPPPPPANPPPCYSKCWMAPLNTQPILFDDFLIDGQTIEQTVAVVPLEDLTDYAIDLKIYNLEKDFYQYWKRLEDQRVLTGSIFDKVPAQVTGNLICTNDPTLEVLGYFGAVSVTKKRLIIDRNKHLNDDLVSKLNLFIKQEGLRNPNKVISKCWEASWINYNLGLNIPPFSE